MLINVIMLIFNVVNFIFNSVLNVQVYLDKIVVY